MVGKVAAALEKIRLHLHIPAAGHSPFSASVVPPSTPLKAIKVSKPSSHIREEVKFLPRVDGQEEAFDQAAAPTTFLI